MNRQSKITLADGMLAEAFAFVLAEENAALAFEVLLARARLVLRGGGTAAGMHALERACDALSERLLAEFPVAAAKIGFDRPATVYVVSEIRNVGGYRQVLEQMIRSRPWERHVVLFTGTMPALHEHGLWRMGQAGAFAMTPDPASGLLDRWLWLRGKLLAYAAQRLVFVHHPEDVVARVCAREMAPLFGPRLYLMHRGAAMADPGKVLARATHLVASPQLRRQLGALRQGLRVGILPDPYEPKRELAAPSLPSPPPALGPPGRLAVLRWRVKRARWRAQVLRVRAADWVAHSPLSLRGWQGMMALARIKRWTRRSDSFVTASAGSEADFLLEGPLGFGAVIAAVLQGTHGRHLHVGVVGTEFRALARNALEQAGVQADRLLFVPAETLLRVALLEHRAGLFLASFPVVDRATLAEAASAAVPVALYRPEESQPSSGGYEAPDDAVFWRQPDDLVDWIARDAGRAAGATARSWQARHGAPARFARRYGAVIEANEGSLTRPISDDGRRAAVEGLFDAAHYLRQLPEAARSLATDPLAEYLATGAAAGRSPHPLFDPAHYLAHLPEAARAVARRDPLAHYLICGEARGHAPHPLFDPNFCARGFRATGPAGQSVLARYAAPSAGGAEAEIAPHQFFDPLHYARQLPFPPEGQPLLIDFLMRGAAKRLSPHPLIEPATLAPEGKASLLEVLLGWLTQAGAGDAGEPQTLPLFDAASFRGQEGKRYALAAPNFLWAHLIEGNRSAHSPHPLIWPEYIERMRPGTMSDPVPALARIVTNGLADVDPHPLISCSHIRRQAPWIAQHGLHPLVYFLERGGPDVIDPHPWFSTQTYHYNNQDVAAAGINPLLHYLNYGQYEGRWPHGFFDGNQYYQRYLRAEGGSQPLTDYARRGAGLFWRTLSYDDGTARLTMKSAEAVFQQSGPGSENPVDHAADLLRMAQHPQTGTRHPSLVTETRQLALQTPTTGEDARDRKTLIPAQSVTVLRPPVVAPHHIAPPSGRYETAEADAALYPDAMVIAGNDGFVTSSGRWLDHGLADFDPAVMDLKGNAAVAALASGKVLLRRYKDGFDISAGVFACGSYSKNYFHFLIETLPRALLAASIAPPGTPILTDDDMPEQHYQALRLLMPHNPVLRLARHRSYKVARLYAASMPNTFQDAFAGPEVPHDAVHLHPVLLRRLAALGPLLRSRGTPRKLFLHRESAWRRLLNAGEITAALEARGFVPVEFAHMSFADQIRHMAGAEAVVGQSGAQMANIVFAQPGCRIFALFSDAPGTNYNLWSGVAAPLGLDLINIAGWRVPGSTGGAAPEAHEHFSVPVGLVTAFFPLSVQGEDPMKLLDALHCAGADADVLTSAWALRAEATPEGFEARLTGLRRRALAALEVASYSRLQSLTSHRFYADPWASLRSGLRALTDHDGTETEAITKITARFAALASGEVADETPERLTRLVLQAVLMVPAWQVPLIGDLRALPEALVPLYLRWIASQPYLFRPGEDAGFVAHAAELLDWLGRHMDSEQPKDLRNLVARTASELDFGQLLLIDMPLRPVLEARNRVLERIALRAGAPRAAPRPADGSHGRRRIGILCRSFEKGPDAEAVVAIFRAFDRAKYEVFAYSIGFQDRVISADSGFDQDFDAAIDHRRMLPADAAGIRARILADDLDAFLYANATTYGLRALDLALYHRVAPAQALMNSHLPMPLGYPSFDAFITGQSDNPANDVPQTDCPERLIRVQGPVISYLTSFRPRKNPPLDRAALGLAHDDLVMMNAGSFQKLRRECLITMLRAVASVPNGVFLVAPYNPGWAARSQAFAFNRQLAEAAAEVGLDPARIRVLSELSVAEAEAALACADIYLNPFPHGGATMTHLALIYGIPPVTLRRRSTRSIDQFLVGSLGFTQLLADSPDEYVAIAQSLATDATARKALGAALRRAARHPVFVDNPDYSRAMQRAVEEVIAGAGDNDAKA